MFGLQQQSVISIAPTTPHEQHFVCSRDHFADGGLQFRASANGMGGPATLVTGQVGSWWSAVMGTAFDVGGARLRVVSAVRDGVFRRAPVRARRRAFVSRR